MAGPRRRAKAHALAALIGVAALAAACSHSPVTPKASKPPTTHPPRTTTTTTPSPSTTVPARPVGALLGGATPVPPPTGPTVSPPASIAANCSTDVSGRLKRWFNHLPVNSTVRVPAQACYRVDKGIRLRAPQGLTVYGGTFESEATTPLPGTKGYAVFTVLGGTGLTLESMKLAGVNPGGYHSAMAFAAGITLEGTSGTTIRGVTIDQPFGDGITLLPLRGGADQNDGTIVAPTTNAVIRDVTVSGPGRQGVAFVSVSGAMVTDILVDNPGSDTFDFEASQWNEGSVNVTIDGCATSGGGIFFANGGLSHSQRTKDITVENCSMATPTAGDAILVYNNGGPKNHRGPITFVADRLWCGHSEAVACVQLTGAQVSVSDSILRFPAGTIHEAVYHLAKKSIASFSQDKVTGYGTLGHASKYSLIQISGGHWVRSPYATP